MTTIDGVIAPYYLLTHALAAGNLTGIRLLSAAAMAATVGLLLWLGTRLAQPWVGIWAGAVLLVNPVASRWAQEARPYALAVALATAATCALVVAVADRQRRSWWVYATLTAALGYAQLVGLLLVAAHAMTVLILDRRHFSRWLLAAGAGVGTTLPLALLGWEQRRAIAWIDEPGIERLEQLPTFFVGPSSLLWVGAAALILSARHQGHPAQRTVLAVALPWLTMPPVLLFVAGQVTSVYTERYLLICLPALALVIGSALTRLATPVSTAFVVVMLSVAIPTHVEQRGSTGHDGDLGSSMRAHIGSAAKSGDAVIYSPQDVRLMAEAYPQHFSRLTDVTLGRTGAQAGTLAGEWPAHMVTTVPARTRDHARVWIISVVGTTFLDPPSRAALDAVADYEVQQVRWFGQYQVELRQRG